MPESLVQVKSPTGTPARRAEPLSWFDDFANDIERLWARPFSIFTGPLPRPFRAVGRASPGFMPRMDAYEKDHAMVIKVELPGLKKEDVQVEIEGEYLVIRGQTSAESEVKDEDYYRSERNFGSFYRRLQLPAGVVAEQIEANLKDGVLEVRIPEPVESKPETTKVPVT